MKDFLVYFTYVWPFGLHIFGHLVYFTAIWYILRPFGIFYGYLLQFCPVFLCCTKKNVATLLRTRRHESFVQSRYVRMQKEKLD
jgi:hypothetical protein